MVDYFLVLILWTAPLSLFLHECGHVLPALWFQADQSHLSLGSFKKLCSLRVYRVHIHIHALFFHGAHSINERSIEFTKKEKACISIGGPLMNGMISCIGFLLGTELSSFHYELFIWFNAYLAIVNSIPFRIRRRESDGYRFFRSFLS